MATRFLERASAFPGVVADQSTSVAPCFIDSDSEEMKFYDHTTAAYRSVVTLDQTQTLTNKTLTSPTITGALAATLTPTEAVALTAAQSGTVVYLNAAAGFAITLPALAAGWRFRFITGAAFATTNFTIVSPGSANIIQGGAIVNSVLVPAANEDTISFVASAETLGDYIDVECDGTNIYVSGVGAAAGSITFTVAS